MPNKMSRSFRLEPESLEQLGRLSDRWGISQAKVLELLIEEAVAEDKILKMEIVSEARSGGAGAGREQGSNSR